MSAPPPQKKARVQNELDLDKKIEVLRKLDSGAPYTYSKLSEEYRVSKSTISRINAQRKELQAAWEANKASTVKRTTIKHNLNFDINTLMIFFFAAARARNIPVSGPLLRQKAKIFADALGIQNFQASEGKQQKKPLF